MMTENNLSIALREVVSSEFSNIPMNEDEIHYTFSNRFLNKMDKLTKAEKSRFWRMTNTAPRRVAVVLASLLIIILTACSIPPVRAAVATFFQETYDNFVLFFTDDVGTEMISEQYILSDVPEGFSEKEVIESDTRCTHIYQNIAGDEIILSQSITADYAVYVDNEQGEISNITISGMDVSIYDSPENHCKVAIWLNGGYAFDLTVYGNYDLDFIIRLVEAVQRQ